MRTKRHWASLCLAGLAFVLGALAILQTGSQSPDIVFRQHPNALADLLQWIPATDETERGFAAWVDVPGAPLTVTEALDRLAIVPGPLAIGRSGEFQRATGISASQVTGWASAYGLGVTVLAGTFDQTEIEETLGDGGYAESSWREVAIWTAPSPRETPLIVQGDDLRALNVIVPMGERVVIATDRSAAEAALAAASGEIDSLADRTEIEDMAGSPQVAGMMVVDQRDLAVECGVAGPWLKSDFESPSGRAVGVAYRLHPENSTPITSVWIDLADDLAAEAGQFSIEDGWRNGFINQTGIGGPVSALASVAEVYPDGTSVVADLVQGRENGWVRSGVRYLVEICEHSSAMVPPGQPTRATPIASPAAEELR